MPLNTARDRSPVSVNPAADASEWLQRRQRGEISAEALTKRYLKRLQAQQPQLNAALKSFPEQALAQARAEDQKPSGVLSGLPISIKENYALAGESISLGSRRKRPLPCSQDAVLVKRLRAAGAVIIARSNVPEFLMNAETDNLLQGRTNNPLDLSRTCGGSSGGEAALVASDSVAAGFGTDILGSIRIPASFCGVVGMRAHSQAIDKTGVEPVSGDFFESWNGLGPIGQSVRDVRLLYSVIADQDLPGPGSPLGARLILGRNFPLRIKDPAIRRAYVAAQAALLESGMREEDADFSQVASLFRHLPQLVCQEMGPLWQSWLEENGQPFSLQTELWRALRGQSSVYPGFLPWLLASGLLPRQAPCKAQALVARYQRAREHFRALLGEDGLLCLPTLGLLAPRHGWMNRQTLWRPGLNGLVTAHTFANYCDLSAISVPASAFADKATGLIPGIMLVCAPGQEALLLDAAQQLSSALSIPAPV